MVVEASDSESEKEWKSEDEPDVPPDPRQNGDDPWAPAAGKGAAKGSREAKGARPPNPPLSAASRSGKGSSGPEGAEQEDPWANGVDPWAASLPPGSRTSQPTGKGSGAGKSQAEMPGKGSGKAGQPEEDPWMANDPWTAGRKERGMDTKGSGMPGQKGMDPGKGSGVPGQKGMYAGKGSEKGMDMGKSFAQPSQPPPQAAPGLDASRSHYAQAPPPVKDPPAPHLNKGGLGKGAAFDTAKPKPPPPPVPVDGDSDCTPRAHGPPMKAVPVPGKGARAGCTADGPPPRRQPPPPDLEDARKRWIGYDRSTMGKVGPMSLEVRRGAEVLLFLYASEGYACVRPHHPAQPPKWVDLNSVSAMPPYDFLVKVRYPMDGESVLGLICEPCEDFEVETLRVIHVEKDSILSRWNDQSARTLPRDQLLAGDRILSVQGQTGRSQMVNLLQNPVEETLELHVVRLAAASLFGPGAALTERLPEAARRPAFQRPPSPARFNELDQFQ